MQVVAPGRPASNLRMAIRRATAKACARLKTRWAGSRLLARRQMRCCQVSGSMRARTSACGEAGDARHTDRGCDCAWQGLCRGRGKQFLRAGAARPLIDLAGLRGEPAACQRDGRAGGARVRGLGRRAVRQLWPVFVARRDGNAHALCSRGVQGSLTRRALAAPKNPG